MDHGQRELSTEELEAETAYELPDREAMSLVFAHIAGPVNSVVASNVGADNTTTVAESEQVETIEQAP
jgi:hypothetical protein